MRHPHCTVWAPGDSWEHFLSDRSCSKVAQNKLIILKWYIFRRIRWARSPLLALVGNCQISTLHCCQAMLVTGCARIIASGNRNSIQERKMEYKMILYFRPVMIMWRFFSVFCSLSFVFMEAIICNKWQYIAAKLFHPSIHLLWLIRVQDAMAAG